MQLDVLTSPRDCPSALALSDSNAAFTAGVEAIVCKDAFNQAVAVAAADAYGVIIYVNDRLCAISGYEQAELLGRDHRMLYSGLHPRSFFTQMYRKISRGRVWRGDIRSRAKDGQWYWMDATVMPMQEQTGRGRGYVFIGGDITERKNAERSMRRKCRAICITNRQLERENQELSDLHQTAERFMDEVSHDLRTPLSVIKGYAEVMHAGLTGPQTGDQKKFHQLIVDRTRDLAQMVDDLLDLSKLRLGSLRMERRSCPVAWLVAALHPMIDGRLASAEIQWAEEIAADLPPVFADPEKVIRVLVNLSSNAFQRSRPGGVIRLSARLTGRGMVSIDVTDEGPGISDAHRAIIYERSGQMGRVLGLTKELVRGLRVARELVALNFGEMGAVGSPGGGSTFGFTLPTDQPRVIIESFLGQVKKLDLPRGKLAVARVGVQGGTAVVPEQIPSLLARAAHCRDLILPTSNQSAWIVVGHCLRSKDWLNSLLQAKTKTEGTTPAACVPLIDIALADQMPYPFADTDACAMVQRHLEAG